MRPLSERRGAAWQISCPYESPNLSKYGRIRRTKVPLVTPDAGQYELARSFAGRQAAVNHLDIGGHQSLERLGRDRATFVRGPLGLGDVSFDAGKRHELGADVRVPRKIASRCRE